MQRIATSPWAVLGLDEGTSLDEVLHAFRVQAKQTHPDHGGDRTAFEELRAAFDAVRTVAPRPVKVAAFPGQNPYAWCDQPLPPAPLPRFQPPRRPHPRPRPHTGRAEAFAKVLESVLAAAA